MTRYVVKRLLYMIPVLLGVAFLVFTILSLTPGDPGSIILDHGQAGGHRRAERRIRL